MPPTCAWSPTARIDRIGVEQHPVVVIDDYAQDPGALIAEAAALEFQPNGAFFPGVRARAPDALVLAIRQSLAGLIREVFGVGEDLDRIECLWSLITTPPGELGPHQRLPHFDGLGAQRIAVLHHLGRGEGGATAFYRHRATGFETLTAARLPAYQRAMDGDLQRFGLPPAAYASDGGPFYERIAAYEARFNRLLVYRGNTLHSANVPPGRPLPADPRTGRFSLNTFIWLDGDPAQALTK
jgi:hypothetical protein